MVKRFLSSLIILCFFNTVSLAEDEIYQLWDIPFGIRQEELENKMEEFGVKFQEFPMTIREGLKVITSTDDLEKEFLGKSIDVIRVELVFDQKTEEWRCSSITLYYEKERFRNCVVDFNKTYGRLFSRASSAYGNADLLFASLDSELVLCKDIDELMDIVNISNQTEEYSVITANSFFKNVILEETIINDDEDYTTARCRIKFRDNIT